MVDTERGFGPFWFPDYRDAFNAAVDLARRQGKEVGLEKFAEYGKPGFRVFNLPRPENRFGFELRCQVVRPDEPKTRRFRIRS